MKYYVDCPGSFRMEVHGTLPSLGATLRFERDRDEWGRKQDANDPVGGCPYEVGRFRVTAYEHVLVPDRNAKNHAIDAEFEVIVFVEPVSSPAIRSTPC